jgi:hypothetical protein
LPLAKADEAVIKHINDETTEYNFEGSGSLATSLSSLDTTVSERDWEETFRCQCYKKAPCL